MRNAPTYTRKASQSAHCEATWRMSVCAAAPGIEHAYAQTRLSREPITEYTIRRARASGPYATASVDTQLPRTSTATT